MSKVNLNGWQRIGVILSIIWIFSAAIHEHSGQVERARMVAEAEHVRCMASIARESGCDFSLALGFEPRLGLTTEVLKHIATASLVPVLLGWFLVWLDIAVYRWVRAGFYQVK
jgi:hypothetical protein